MLLRNPITEISGGISATENDEIESYEIETDEIQDNENAGIGKAANSDWDPDSLILQARGVSSHGELNEKYDYGVLKPQYRTDF